MRERGIRAQRIDVGVRMGITVWFITFRHFGKWDGTLIVRVVGMIVAVTLMVVAMVLADLVRVLHLDRRIWPDHVNKRDGNDQQALDNGSHFISTSFRECANGIFRWRAQPSCRLNCVKANLRPLLTIRNSTIRISCSDLQIE